MNLMTGAYHAGQVEPEEPVITILSQSLPTEQPLYPQDMAYSVLAKDGLLPTAECERANNARWWPRS